MPKKSFRQAVNEALRQEMERDPRVILIGEDVAGGMGAPGEQDAWGGPLGVTKGLMPIFGRDRVLDTPITESGFIGAAAGAATTGLRPVVEGLPKTGKFADRRHSFTDLGPRQARQHSQNECVFSARILGMNPRSEVEECSHPPAQLDVAFGRAQCAGQRLQQRRLSGSVSSDDPERFAGSYGEIDVIERF